MTRHVPVTYLSHMSRPVEPDAPAGQPRPCDASLLDGLIDYVSWASGVGALEHAMERLVVQLGAAGGRLVRLDRGRDHVAVAASVSHGGRSGAEVRLLGAPGIDGMTPGELRVLATGGPRPVGDLPARTAQDAPARPAAIVICLENDGPIQDLMEFRYDAPLSQTVVGALRRSADLLARAHARRDPGIVDAAFSAGAADAVASVPADILGPANPFGLTSAEVRVCAAIANGLSVKGVAFELDRSTNTVRTHLRNIYDKTGLHGYFALAHALISQGSGAAVMRRAA